MSFWATFGANLAMNLLGGSGKSGARAQATPAQQTIIREELPVISREIDLIEDRYVGKELVSKIKDIFKNLLLIKTLDLAE